MSHARTRHCRAHRATLDAIVDGREQTDALQALELHAESCPRCAALLAESRALRAALDALPAPAFDRANDDAFVARVFEAIDATDRSAVRASRSPRLAIVTAAAATAAAAAAAAALLLVLGVREPVVVPVTPEPVELAEVPAPAPVVLDEVAALPPVLRATEATADAEQLAAALDEVAVALRFDPASPESAEDFARAVRRRVDGDVAPAARELLDDPTCSAIAARLLGVTADVRDRDLLARSVADVGAPAALALADRGEPGLRRLWSMAAAVDSTPDAGVARSALLAVARFVDDDREIVRAAPVDAPAALVAPIVTASHERGATRAVTGFLDGGEDAWLEALAGRPDAADAVATELDANPRERERALDLVARHGDERCLSFVLSCLRTEERGAGAALAALPVDPTVDAILELARRGRLREEVEESAWRALAFDGSESLLAAIETRATEPRSASDLDAVLDALMRADVLAVGDDVSARELLLALCEVDAIDVEVRALALLYVAESTRDDGEMTSTEALRLTALRASYDVELAAAAWIAQARDPEVRATAPTAVRTALEREAPPSVRLLRVARALEGARSDRERTTP